MAYCNSSLFYFFIILSMWKIHLKESWFIFCQVLSFYMTLFVCGRPRPRYADVDSANLQAKKFRSPPGWPWGVIFKSEFYRNLIFWNCYAKKMVKILHNFFCEKISPLCIFLGILTDFAQKYAPLCLLRSPKYPKIDENPILGLFLVRFW